MLGEFFDNLDSSIRLLRMKGSMSSFSNISPKIESLTDRYRLLLYCLFFSFFFFDFLIVNVIFLGGLRINIWRN